MTVTMGQRPSKNQQKIWYYFQWGKKSGQRLTTGVFTYRKPKDSIEKKHNIEALAILKAKHSQLILDSQLTQVDYVPLYKLKSNFLDFYEEYVKKNKIYGNRHLECSLEAFKLFVNKDRVLPSEITEELCEAFRDYLLKSYNGETPANYFYRFKRVIKSATKNGYFRHSPAEDISSKRRKNTKPKDILSLEEYQLLMKTPCLNYEVKKAFVFSLYTGLRWVDIKMLSWKSINNSSLSMIQTKTQVPLEIPLHKIAIQILGNRRDGLVFHLPDHKGASKALLQWCKNAGITKHITWHCARHSFSVLLTTKGVDDATVAGMLGHTSTKYVQKVYKRYIFKNAERGIRVLPDRDDD